MKYQILDNNKIVFFNTIGDKTGEIYISSSGDFYITPTSGSTRDIILGDQTTVGDIELGSPAAESIWKFMGGGKISANGNTLTIGDSALGDTVIFDASVFSGSFSGSFQGDGSNLTGVGGGSGGSGIFVQTGSFYSTTNDLQITGSLLVSGSGIEFKTSNGTVFKIGDTGSFALGEGATNTVDTNVAIGKNSITEGAYNVAVGNAADNDGGSYNIAIGSGANTANVSYGIAIGGSAYSNSKTISIGHSAIGADGTIAIGYDAGHSAGENNILIGLNAGNSTSGDGNIIIGSGSLGGNFNNQLRIGSGNSIVTISGSLATGDIHFYNTASAPNFSGSFQGDGSNLTGVSAGTTVIANPGSSGDGALSTITIGAQNFSVGGGSGGGSIFTASNGYQQTINNLIISESNASSSLSVINSGSTIFDVQGSVGQLFEVQDGLDGVLMSVNDISGIPILTVSSSGDVILAQGSNLLGTASVALNVPGVSQAFPFTGSASISGSLNINGSGSSIFDVDGTVGSLFSVNDGLDGIVMSVNDISGLPLFEVSSSGDVELVTGNISGSGISTASFGKIFVNGTDVSSSLGGSGGTTVIANPGSSGGGGLTTIGIAGTNYSVGGGSAPAGTVSGSAQITELGFVTSSATASFITTAQTASFMTSSATGSFNNLIITNLSGSLVPGDGSTISYPVTVVSSGGDKFAIDLGSGAQTTPDFNLLAGNTYRFTQEDGTNSGHPIDFVKFSDESSVSGVTIIGNAGSVGSYTQVVVTNSTPKLKYRCTVHGTNMGGPNAAVTITTGSLIQNGFLEVSGSTRLSGSLDVLTNITASGNISASGYVSASGFIGNGDAIITGQVGIGSAASAKLSVKGQGNSSSTTTVLIENSTGNDIFRIKDDRTIALLGASTFYNGVEIDTGNLSGSATSTASFGTYLGDGSQLTGVGGSTGAFGISNSIGVYTYYTSLSASMAAASTGDVVEVFADTVVSGSVSEAVTILLKNGVNINGNGHKYTLNHSSSIAAFADYLSTETSGTSISSSIHNLRIDRINGDTSTGLKAATIYINNDTSNHDTFLDLRGSEISNNTSDTYFCSYKHGRVLGGKFIGNHNGRYFISAAQVQYTGTHNLTDVYCESEDGYAQVDDAGNSTFVSKNNTAALVTQGDFVGCTFVSNASSPSQNGAAVTQQGSISGAKLKNCNVWCNGSGTTAVYGVAWIENCTIVNARYYALNYAIDTGGAQSFTLLNSSIYSKAGSAIKVQDGSNTGTLRILNNTIHNDRYSTYGAYPTMYLQGWDNSDTLISNNTIVHGGPYKSGNLANAIEVHSGGGSNYTFNIVNNTIKVSQYDAFCISSSAAVAPNIVYAQNTFEGANVPVAPSIIQTLTNVPDAQGNIHVTSSLDNSRIYSGSFSGSYVGNGSGLTNLPPATLPSGVLSGSAQIATEISGAFVAPSASFSTRVTTNETNITSLTSVTGSYAITGSNKFIGNQQITGSLIVSSSSDVSLDVKGDIDATGIISASKFTVSSSAASLPGYTFWHQGGTGMLSTAPGYLQFQVAGGGSPEFDLTTGTATFRVNAAFASKEISGPTRIRGVGSITGSNFQLPISGSVIVDGNQQISGSLIVSSSGAQNIFEAGSSESGKARFIITDQAASYRAFLNGELYLGADGVNPSIHFGTDNAIWTLDRNGNDGLKIANIHFNGGSSISVWNHLQVGRDTADSLTQNYLSVTGSAVISGSTGLRVHGSGSTVFEVAGSDGTLLSIDDDLDGTVFTANDRTGLPILEASASGEVYIGKSPQSLYTTAVISSNTANVTQSIYGLDTSSYAGAFFEYTAFSGSHDARAGTITAIWSGSQVNHTDIKTLDFGNTSNLTMKVHISQSQAQLASYSTTGGYKIKTIVRSI